MDDDKYERMEGLVKEFETGVGRRLQKYLVLKSWWATNYVSPAAVVCSHLAIKTSLILSNKVIL